MPGALTPGETIAYHSCRLLREKAYAAEISCATEKRGSLESRADNDYVFELRVVLEPGQLGEHAADQNRVAIVAGG